MSESRRIRRFLLRKGETKWRVTEYVDNKGNAYAYKCVARLSSFYNLFMGCLKNGFPVAVSYLWYSAWAFYPFFFVRKDLKVESAVVTLNHERIHIRQQRDLHLLISVPLLALCVVAEVFGMFNPVFLLCTIPFVPTIIYGIDMFVTYMRLLSDNGNMFLTTFAEVRQNTCFEREAINKSLNEDYLFTRKFMAVLAYTGIKWFSKYGI